MILPRGVTAPDDASGRLHSACATRVPSRPCELRVMFLKQDAMQRRALRTRYTTSAPLRPILRTVRPSPSIHSSSRLSAGRQSPTRAAPYSWLTSRVHTRWAPCLLWLDATYALPCRHAPQKASDAWGLGSGSSGPARSQGATTSWQLGGIRSW